jgi:tripartite-type tricarboxylate transporter receptor subunit TctC
MSRGSHFRRVAVAGLTLATGVALAQDFPARPVSIVVPFGPGGTTDIMARLLQEELGKALGTTVVVINTAGAGGSIGMGNVARAAADGYTVAMTTIGPLTIQPARRDNTGYTPDSFDYICGTYDVPMLTMVPASSPHKDYPALVAWAKANPGKLNYGSSGLGTMPHISGLQQWKHHGVEVLHVPYKSTGDMVVPLKNGELTMFNETPPVARQHQLRPILALSDRPVPGFEEVPTAAKLGVPVRGSVWGGLIAPKGLPADVLGKLEAACKTATDTTIYRARAQAANSPLVYRDGAAFRAFARAEFDKHRKIVIENGLQDR